MDKVIENGSPANSVNYTPAQEVVIHDLVHRGLYVNIGYISKRPFMWDEESHIEDLKYGTLLELVEREMEDVSLNKEMSDISVSRVDKVMEYWQKKNAYKEQQRATVREEVAIARNRNKQSEWMVGKNRPNDKYVDSYASCGVRFLKEPVLTVSQTHRLKKIFPRVCVGEFDIKVLGAAFRNVSRVLYKNMWLISEQIEDRVYFKFFRAFFEEGKVLANLKSKAVPIENRHSDSLVYFVKNYKLFLEVFCGKTTNNFEKRVREYFIMTSRFRQGVESDKGFKTTRIATKTIPPVFEAQMWDTLRSKVVGVTSSFVKDVIVDASGSEEVHEAVSGTVFSVISSFVGEIPARIADCLKGLVSSFSEALGSLLEFLAGVWERIREGFVSAVCALSETITPEVIKTFAVAASIFIFIYVLYLVRDSVRSLGRIAESLGVLVLEKIGYPIQSVHCNLMDILGKDAYEAQGLTDLVPIFGAACGIALSCTSKTNSMAANSAVVFAEKLPHVVSTVGDAIANCLDYIWMKQFGSHFVAERAHFDEFERFIKSYTEFMALPGVDKSIFTDLTVCARLKLLDEQAKKLQPMLFHMNAEPKLQNVLTRAFTKVHELHDQAKDRADYYKTRIETPLLWLHGDPGQGKTTVLEYVIAAVYRNVQKHFPEQFQQDWSRAHMYHRDKTSSYWEGYKQQFACVWNEAFEKKEARERAITASELLTACEDGCFPLNMAFDMKGKAFFNSCLAVVSSNLKECDLASACGLSAPEALARRRTLYLRVERDKDFDTKKGNFNEAWKFILRKPDSPAFLEAFKLGTPTKWKEIVEKEGNVIMRFSDVVNTLVDQIVDRINHRSDKTEFMRNFDFVKYVDNNTCDIESDPIYNRPEKKTEKKKDVRYVKVIKEDQPKPKKNRVWKEKRSEMETTTKPITMQMYGFGKRNTGMLYSPVMLGDRDISQIRGLRGGLRVVPIANEVRIEGTGPDIWSLTADQVTTLLHEVKKDGDIKLVASKDPLSRLKAYVSHMSLSSVPKTRRRVVRLLKYLLVGFKYIFREKALIRIRRILKDAGLVNNKMYWELLFKAVWTCSHTAICLNQNSTDVGDQVLNHLGWAKQAIYEKITTCPWSRVPDGFRPMEVMTEKFVTMYVNHEVEVLKEDDYEYFVRLLSPTQSFKDNHPVYSNHEEWWPYVYELRDRWNEYLDGTICPFLTKYGHYVLLGIGGLIALGLGMMAIKKEESLGPDIIKEHLRVPTKAPEEWRDQRLRPDQAQTFGEREQSNRYDLRNEFKPREPRREKKSTRLGVEVQSLPEGQHHQLPGPRLPVIGQSLPEGQNHQLPGARLPVVTQGGTLYRALSFEEWNEPIDGYLRHTGWRTNSQTLAESGYHSSIKDDDPVFNECVARMYTCRNDDEAAQAMQTILPIIREKGFHLGFFEDMYKWKKYTAQNDVGMQVGGLSAFMREVRLQYAEGFITAKGILSGRRFITNEHWFINGYDYQRVELINNGVVTTTCLAEHVRVSRAPQFRDLVYLDFDPKIMNAQQSLKNKLYKNMDDMYSNMNMEAEFSRMTKTVMNNGQVVIERIRRNGAVKGTTPITETTNVGKVDIKNYYTLAGAMGNAGDCGEVYTNQDHTNVVKVVGLHSGRSGNDSYFVPIFQSDLKEDGFDAQAYIPEWLKYITPEVSPPTYTGKYIYMGQVVKKKIIPDKTNLIATQAQGNGNMDPMYPIKTYPAILKVSRFRDEVVFPLDSAMKKLGRSPMRPMTKWMMELVLKHPSIIFDGFFPKYMNLKNVRPWTIEEALFGIPGVWKGLAQDTAIGYDMECISKYKSRREIWDCERRWISPILRQLVEKLNQAVRDGLVPKNVVAGCLKDETRPEEKVATPRLFCVGSLSHLVWTVMWMGALVTEMKRNRSTSDVAIGTNVYGFDWNLILKKFEAFARCKFGCGDFGDYDTSENIWLGWALGEACVPFYGLPKDSWEEKCVRYACESALAPLLVVGGQLYWMDYFNSSGGWLTGFLNSFVNIFIFNACFFYVQAFSDDEDFKDAKRRDVLILFVYGDDNIWAILEKYSRHFNMIILEKLVFELFGMKYTTASKKAILEPFVEREDVEFLKRKLIRDGSLSRAPLEPESIHSMVLWIHKPKRKEELLPGEQQTTIEEQFLINVETACAEWFQHGREVFNRETEHMRAYLKELGLRWPGQSYQLYAERWARNING
jgi:hypothetical protein